MWQETGVGEAGRGLDTAQESAIFIKQGDMSDLFFMKKTVMDSQGYYEAL